MSSFYTKAVSGLFFPLHERMKGHSTARVHRLLEKTQWLSAEEIRQLQVEKLKCFLTDIWEHVPYYGKLFYDIGFNPETITSISDIQILPFLTKAVIRENTDSLKAGNTAGLSRFNTGGSSGEPLIFYIGKERISHDVAEKWRATRWWGVDIGDPEMVVWGSPIELGTQDKVREIRDRVLRTKLLPAFEMTDAKLDKFIHQIREMKPKMLFGYPSSLSLIAKHAEKRIQRM
ncbi:MAG: phenylacetate--CoA ligase family protein, partial [Gammaproteobacteria bacterium]|nr:phenylacetate--CoA ligase family protein [Gammaproteobacteria bacterium]